MKKAILYAVCIFLATSAFATEGPAATLVQKFNTTFPNAKNIKWREVKDGFFVSFSQADNFSKVLYDADGNFVYSLKYAGADDLPTNVLMVLNKKFGEYKNLGVTEATTQDRTFYNVKLSKDDKMYSMDVSSDGIISKLQSYTDGTSMNVSAEQ
ncbi:MAG: hypothetical protein JST21_14275 [Bacteroidetes bacterium]|nr:hypothetical protein [Bacteroidota bacterium]